MVSIFTRNLYKDYKIPISNQQYLSNRENTDVVEMVFSKEEFDCSDHDEYKNEDLVEKGSDDEEYDKVLLSLRSSFSISSSFLVLIPFPYCFFRKLGKVFFF